MTIQQYDEYKDSGIAWLGSVPKHWLKMRMKFLFSQSNSGIWGNDEQGDENDIVCFRVADFDYNSGNLRVDRITLRNIAPDQLEGRLLSEGDLLIEKSGGGDVTPVGRVVRYNYNEPAVCSNFIHFVSVASEYNSDYCYYYFYSLYANKVNTLYFNQTTGIQNLKIGEYLGQPAFLPPLSEQEAIVRYLDERCGEVDKRIELEGKRIKLLTELKQSIITQAVTEGLDPNTPKRDSGVPWLGQIPQHWEVRKTSLIFPFIGSGTTPSTSKKEYYSEDGDYHWLQTGDLNDGLIYDTSKRITQIALEECNLRIYPKESVIVAMYGATIGKVGLLKIYTTTNQACCVLPKSSLCNEYFALNLLMVAKPHLLVSAVGGGQPNISQDIIRRTKLPLPPLSEQEAIVSYIEERCGEIDGRIERAKRKIELLTELKQSIITEAVTGKIKVC